MNIVLAISLIARALLCARYCAMNLTIAPELPISKAEKCIVTEPSRIHSPYSDLPR